jgi:hypothetical protein
MTEAELNAFVHGMRADRLAQHMTQREFTRAVCAINPVLTPGRIAQTELVAGAYRVYSRYPELRAVVAEVLGTPESELIKIGKSILREHGCHACRLQKSRDCRAHN